MEKSFIRFLIFLNLVLVASAMANEIGEGKALASRKSPAPNRSYQGPALSRSPAAEARVRGWLASMGAGLFFDPSVFLLNPQLEYLLRHNLHIGPMVQLGLGSGTIFTGSFTGRYLFGHSRVKPSVEAGLGMAFASGGAVGLHIPIGVGVDYQLEHGIAVGTMFRANLFVGSSFNTLSISWPIVIGRFAL